MNTTLSAHWAHHETMGRAFRLVLAFLCAVILAERSCAASESVSAPLQLVLLPPKSPRLINDQLPLRGRLVGTDAEGVFITEIIWWVDDAVDATRAPISDDWRSATKQVPKDVVKSGEQASLTFTLPSVPTDLHSLWKNPSLLFFDGGRSKITVLISYTVKVGDPIKQIEQTLDVEFLPAPTALAIGGLCGSLLLVIFERLVRLYQALQRAAWPTGQGAKVFWAWCWNKGCPWIIRELPSGLVQFLLGGMTAVLVLLVIGVGQGKDIPVMIEVKGFIGAVGLALFTHVLAVWLYKKLVA